MLRIKEVRIWNYRSIRQEVFRLPALTILVGKNDVGKSNLMEAIKILLEGTPGSVTGEDFYDVGAPLEIRAVLEGVSDYLELCDDRTRPKIADRLNTDGLLEIRRVAQGPKQLSEIEVSDPESGQFSNIGGISAPLKPLLPEVIFISALADVADETKGTQKDALGQLVNQVMSGIVKQLEPRVRDAYTEANRVLNGPPAGGADANTRAPELVAIEDEITGYLKGTFPNASVRLRIELASVQEILQRVHVMVKEGTSEDAYYRRGHGMQRTLYLSLLRAEAARIRRTQRVARPFILLFEEPEAFLHPDGQVKMREALRSISGGAQVILATHSPLMVTPASLPHTIRIEKRSEAGSPRPATRGFGPIDPEKLTDLQRQLIPLFAIQRSSRFLFSRGVLLVEGTSDDHLFSAIAERFGPLRLEDFEVGIVETGGKGNFGTFAEVLHMLGLSVWVLTDLDFLWEGAGEVLGADPDLSRFLQALQALVPAAGNIDETAKRREKTLRTNACSTELATQRDTICEKLFMRGIFVLRHGEIENYVGLGQSAKGQYLGAADEIRQGRRDVQNEGDFTRILDALRAWASPPTIL